MGIEAVLVVQQDLLHYLEQGVAVVAHQVQMVVTLIFSLLCLLDREQYKRMQVQGEKGGMEQDALAQ